MPSTGRRPAPPPARAGTHPRRPSRRSSRRTSPRLEPRRECAAQLRCRNRPPFREERPRPFGLDAADYLPITRKEIKEAAKGKNIFSPWFGLRNKIPPADDLRTQLIDRAMVTQGLITPEQLAEIHAVGAEMDRVRPTETAIAHQAAMTGEAAVQAQKGGPCADQGPEEGRGRGAQTAAGRGDRLAQGQRYRLPRQGRLGPSGRTDQPGRGPPPRRAARDEHAGRAGRAPSG